MIKKKNLFLLCDCYPVTPGEFFIDDEMRVIAYQFEKVFVVVKSENKVDLNRFVPENMIVCSIDDSVSITDKLIALPKIITLFFYEEWRLSVTNYKLKSSIFLFKLMYMDVVRALKLKKQISKILKEEHIDALNTIFYSYWHDYKALALSMMKEENSALVCIARAHGWDVFFGRHRPPYLPFKCYILNNLTGTFSISEAGQHELQKYTNHPDKVVVSRLGKINHRLPKWECRNNRLLICSCSNIIPLKRLDKIIDVLSRFENKDIEWVHFGEGCLRSKMEHLAAEKLSQIKFEFKGLTPNTSILDYYHENNVDLFINLSESEGIPVSIMEAFSAGIPVLATNVGGVSEIVNNQNGFLLAKDFEINEVVKVIEGYLDIPKERKMEFRMNAYNTWNKCYNAEKNYREFYEEITKIKGV